jgi:hypothetical protein
MCRRMECDRRHVEQHEERRDPLHYCLFKAFLRDLAVAREIEKFVRLPVPVQATHPDVRICGRPVHLPPALFGAPLVNQTIHVFFHDARLLCLTVSVLHELVPPAVARLCLLTDLKQGAQARSRAGQRSCPVHGRACRPLSDADRGVRCVRDAGARTAPRVGTSVDRSSAAVGSVAESSSEKRAPRILARMFRPERPHARSCGHLCGTNGNSPPTRHIPVAASRWLAFQINDNRVCPVRAGRRRFAQRLVRNRHLRGGRLYADTGRDAGEVGVV